MPPQQTSFGILLARLRERRDLSLRELGLISGVDHAYIHRLETGEKGRRQVMSLTVSLGTSKLRRVKPPFSRSYRRLMLLRTFWIWCWRTAPLTFGIFSRRL